jgi:hypothetical protein
VAEVYASIQGAPFEDWLAHTRMVNDGVHTHAAQRATIAKRIHAEHRKEGHSYVELTKGDRTDWFVNLNDERGLRAAMSIEFGRGASEPDDPTAPALGQTRGTWTLHRAFGLPFDVHFPHRRPEGKRVTPKRRRRR